MSAPGEPAAPEVAAATLVNLRGMTPARLRALFERWPEPEDALDAVRTGRALGPLVRAAPARLRAAVETRAAEWRSECDPAATARLLLARGTRAWWETSAGYPVADAVPERPAVLLGEGADPEVLARPRVAVVGTRQASPAGLADARELGAYLAEHGVTVVSGLAIGIDGAAHEGALDAGGGAVGVVATGLDVVYPRRHGPLSARVRSSGLLLSETGYGVGPERRRFPVRNRIIAALADVVVVVEATATGGARITARHALEYGRPILAVPGSRRNPAAAGTNALLADGAHPLLEWSDVLIALGMTPGPRRRPAPAPELPGDADAAAVLGALGGEPASPDQLATRTGLSIDRVALAVGRLERAGRVELSRGWAWPR